MANPVEGSVRGGFRSVTIALGGSLTDPIDLLDLRLGIIQMPALWTAANLTFQIAPDGATLADFYDGSGTEYTITAAASHSILIPLADFLGARFINIRSGTGAAPVNQVAARVLLLGLAA